MEHEHLTGDYKSGLQVESLVDGWNKLNQNQKYKCTYKQSRVTGCETSNRLIEKRNYVGNVNTPYLN